MMIWRSLLLVSLVVSLFSFELDDIVIDPEIIEKVNSDPSSSWKAGRNPFFEGKTYRDILTLFSSRIFSKKEDSRTLKEHKSSQNNLPVHYDFYDEFPTCTQKVRDQGQCGDDYAFASAQALGDRFCRAYNGTKGTFILSPQDYVSCDPNEYGCSGGTMVSVMEYLVKEGIVTETCLPYDSQGGVVKPCPYKCNDSSEVWKSSKHKLKKYYKLNSMEEAMEDIRKYGSFITVVDGFQDFMQYKSGVYRHQSGGAVGSHVMKIQGWGVDSASGLPYWNCQLAWTTGFGMDGYMWFLRGHDECAFEDYMFGGIVDL